MKGTPAKARPLPGGFPNFKRHLAAIHRMPPTHSPVRPFHVSDVVYAMLRHGVGQQNLRRTGNAPIADKLTQEKAAKGGKSNSMWKSLLKRPY